MIAGVRENGEAATSRPGTDGPAAIAALREQLAATQRMAQELCHLVTGQGRRWSDERLTHLRTLAAAIEQSLTIAEFTVSSLAPDTSASRRTNRGIPTE